MANPTPIYQVEYAGELLPGYVQSDERPLVMRGVTDNILGREGALQRNTGAEIRQITLPFLVKSRLSAATELEHLEDCQDQWREALALTSRYYTEQTLQIHDTDRHYLALYRNSTMPMEAGKSRSMVYTMRFDAQPFAIANSPVSDTLTGNGTATLTIGTQSRRTYPIFTIGGNVDEFTAVDPNGKTIEFLRGTQPGVVAIDCGKLICYRTADNSNAILTMQNLDFGMYYDDGTGSYDIDITGYVGSGNISINMYARYEM